MARATPEVLHLTFTSVRQSRQFYTSIISISGFTIQEVQLQQDSPVTHLYSMLLIKTTVSTQQNIDYGL
ncbi:hypothetical protein MKX68_28590 [Paenibacillus sp. FSL M8-0212]|uniref:hypothetical protein n=1 Tax=unclassified Paenibacillus TaxID=185978 RepID=UPI0030CC5200